MLWVGVEVDLRFRNPVIRDGDDVPVTAALASSSEWPQPAHDGDGGASLSFLSCREWCKWQRVLDDVLRTKNPDTHFERARLIEQGYQIGNRGCTWNPRESKVGGGGKGRL
jgi:hypothetical protein